MSLILENLVFSPADCDSLSLFSRFKLELREMSPALDPFVTMLETQVELVTQDRLLC